MTTMVRDHNGQGPQWQGTTVDDHNGQGPQWTGTTMVNDHNGATTMVRPQWLGTTIDLIRAYMNTATTPAYLLLCKNFKYANILYTI